MLKKKKTHWTIKSLRFFATPKHTDSKAINPFLPFENSHVFQINYQGEQVLGRVPLKTGLLKPKTFVSHAWPLPQWAPWGSMCPHIPFLFFSHIKFLLWVSSATPKALTLIYKLVTPNQYLEPCPVILSSRLSHPSGYWVSPPWFP